MRALAAILVLALAMPARAADPTAITSKQPTAPTDVSGWTPPRPLTSHALTDADYPEESVAANEEGRTTIRYLVGEDGSVIETTVVSSSGSPRLDEAAQSVVKRWRFQAALHDGKPSPMWQAAAIVFKLHGTSACAARPGVLPPGSAIPIQNRDYPPSAIRMNQEGDVYVRYLVQENGSVGEVQIAKSSGYPSLDQAAILAVKRWQFCPAIANGKPVATWTQSVVRYRLR